MTEKTHESAGPEADDQPAKQPKKHLSPAAQRALAEAEARRKKAEAEAAKAEAEREVGGRGGKDPARYGDWEINGRAIDF